MNRNPLVLLYPLTALGIAALIYAAIRRHTQAGASRAELEDQRRRIYDLEEYLRPLREYSKNRINPL